MTIEQMKEELQRLMKEMDDVTGMMYYYRSYGYTKAASEQKERLEALEQKASALDLEIKEMEKNQ